MRVERRCGERLLWSAREGEVGVGACARGGGRRPVLAALGGRRARACGTEQKGGEGEGRREEKEKEKKRKNGKREEKKRKRKREGEREGERARDSLGGDRGVDRGCMCTRVGRAWRGGRRYATHGTGKREERNND